VFRFLVLAFGITWILVSPLVLSEWGVLPPLPEWLHGLGALGPVLAAYFSERHRGVFESAGPPRLNLAWIVLCLATPVLFAAIAISFVRLQGEPVLAPLSRVAGDPRWLVTLLTGSVLYGLGEEPGWRGWLQPRLQETNSPFVATLILAPIWAAWHAPFFAYRFDFGGAGTVVGFFIALLAGAFWMAFLYNGTLSVKLVAGWHVLWNVANLALAEISDTAVGVLNGLMIVLGFGAAVALARRPAVPIGQEIRPGTPDASSTG
jgi:membrane protease YdiL (CAAX protease family)